MQVPAEVQGSVAFWRWPVRPASGKKLFDLEIAEPSGDGVDAEETISPVGHACLLLGQGMEYRANSLFESLLPGLDCL